MCVLDLIFKDDIIRHTYFKVSLPNQIADIIFSRQRNRRCILKFKCLCGQGIKAKIGLDLHFDLLLNSSVRCSPVVSHLDPKTEQTSSNDLTQIFFKDNVQKI